MYTQEELTNQSDLYLYYDIAPITSKIPNSLKEKDMEDDEIENDKPKSRRGSMNKAEKRAEHNAIERARRECLNSKFQQLAEALPNLQNHRRPSKGQIVEKALDWVKQNMTKEDRLKYQIMQLQNENKRLLCQINVIQDKQINTGVITSPPQTPTPTTNFNIYMPHPLEFHHPFQQQQMDFLLPTTTTTNEDDNNSNSSTDDIQLLYNDITTQYQVSEALNHPLQKHSYYS